MKRHLSTYLIRFINDDIVGWFLVLIEANMWRIMERSGWWYKGKWKWMGNGHFLKGIHEGVLKVIKHFKLLIMYCMIWKNG